MRNLTLKQLKAIQAITGHGKIINAAKALGLTPPAVTIQLKQLEEDVGLALFDRTQDGMRLTAAGRAVVDTAQAIEERLQLVTSIALNAEFADQLLKVGFRMRQLPDVLQ